MIALYCVCAEALDEATMARWLPRIAAEKAERIGRMHPQNAKTSMAGELLLRYGLWDTFGVAPSTVRTKLDALGKPQLESHPNLHFNLSHTGNWCLCAVADRPVGVDLQEQRSVRQQEVVRRMFTDAEQKFYRDAGSTTDAFFTLWARKEAIGKLTGQGLCGFGKESQVDYELVLETAFQDCRLCVVSARREHPEDRSSDREAAQDSTAQ